MTYVIGNYKLRQVSAGTLRRRFSRKEPGMELQIVNPDPRYSKVGLIEPTTLGYIHVAAEVHPTRLPFMPNGREKSELLGRLKELARQLERLDTVEKATVFDAIAFAPPSSYVGERGDAVRVARFDVVVLIEAASPEAARQVQRTRPYEALIEALTSKARQMHVTVARNARRVGDVDKTRKGLFLFNYFVGDDARVTLELWDYLAGWYEVETGMDNSILLAPLEDEESDYAVINNARWDGGLLRFMWRQMSKKSFRSYMLANLEANHVGAMPVLYSLADAPGRAAGPERRTLLVGATFGLIAVVALSRMLRRRSSLRSRRGHMAKWRVAP